MAAEDTIKKMLAAFNRHNAKRMAAFYSPRSVAYDPTSPEPIKGRDAIQKDAETFLTAFPDLRMKAVRTVAKGSAAAMEMELTGTHKGPLTSPAGTIPPTNKRVKLTGAAFLRFNPQWEITEERRYFDTGAFMQQLGLMPPPGGQGR